MEVNSLVNDVARPVGDDPVRKVTNEVDWITEIGCGDSTNSISSSMYSAAPIGPNWQPRSLFTGKRNKVTEGPSETGGLAQVVHIVKVDRGGVFHERLLEIESAERPADSRN